VACTGPYAVAPSDGGVCVACGGNGQDCCPGIGGGWCGAPYACNNSNRCQPCGGAGEQCCAGGTCGGTRTCSATTNTCN
jgi:hypothetical protein